MADGFGPGPAAGGMPESLDRLVTELARLPGIGRRTAQRLAVHLVRADAQQSIQLARSLDMARERIVRCHRCFGFSEAPVCGICLDPRRETTLVCVVEEPTDVLLVERTAEWRGLYHVLGGALSPLEGIDPADLTLAQLEERIAEDGVTEVVVATNPTMSGEATASYVADLLRGRCRVTRPASGLPVGSDLDQADELTIGKAFSGRRDLA
ncbi:MAG: replication and repair protein RecR [Thermoleophilia bacterium]|nr:replication and repair protein RecR [Thermoleophilia bacterium]